MRKRLILALLACVGLAAVIGGWVWEARGESVASVHPRRGIAIDLVYATGFVEPDQPVSVSARFTAPVAAVLASEGDHVAMGQPLLRLDDSDLRGALLQAQAQSQGASLAETRALTLFAEGWVTRAARDVAVANADAARAATAVASARLGQNVVRAGIDGIVIKRDVEPGELATPARVLMMLGDPAHIRVTATIDERDIPRVRVGQPALLSSDAWPGRIIRGHVRALTPSGDPTQRAFRVRLAVDDGSLLPMGMSLEANIVSRQVGNALLVPNTVLTQSSVWIIQEGRVRKKVVTTGIVGALETQIVAGLHGDEQLVDQPPADLVEGARVRTMPK